MEKMSQEKHFGISAFAQANFHGNFMILVIEAGMLKTLQLVATIMDPFATQLGTVMSICISGIS